MTDHESLLLARILVLRAAVRTYLDGYTARTPRQDAIALRKLKDVLEDTK